MTIYQVSEEQKNNVFKEIQNIATKYGNTPGNIGKFLWRYERNTEDIEDIVQEAYLAALECSEKFQNKSSVKSWLLGIMVNVARHHVSNRVNEANNIREHINGIASGVELNEIEQANSNNCPIQQLHAKELQEAIIFVLDSLSIELKKTFELACIYEKSYQEVAEIMDVPIGTVRSRINRVRLLLRNFIEAKNGVKYNI